MYNIKLKKISSKRSKFFVLVLLTIGILIGGGFLVKAEGLLKKKVVQPEVSAKPVESISQPSQNVTGVQTQVVQPSRPTPVNNSNQAPVSKSAASTSKKMTTVRAASSQSSQINLNSTESAILNLVNSTRKDNGLGAVTYNSKLEQVAQAKAADMNNQNYFAHTNPEGKSDFSFASDAGYKYKWIGSNIAKGDFSSVSAVFTAWMNSPEHKANILGVQGVEIGYAQCGQYFSFFIAASQ